MKVSDLSTRLGFEAICAPAGDADVTDGYASDLLSDVMAKAGDGSVLITRITSYNVCYTKLLRVSGHQRYQHRQVGQELPTEFRERHLDEDADREGEQGYQPAAVDADGLGDRRGVRTVGVV